MFELYFNLKKKEKKERRFKKRKNANSECLDATDYVSGSLDTFCDKKLCYSVHVFHRLPEF